MRKVLIGVVSLGAVLGVYLLYNRVSDSTMMKTGPDAEFTDPEADSNDTALENEMGQIGEVGLGTVRKAKYITLDPKTKRLEREFGFERLLHEAGDIWEIEKPYMNVYRRNFTCYITADKGEVEVETAVGRTTPQDATFSSNVVIHIVPEGTGSVQESFVYLDNIVFLSERSLLSTAGPVRFVSEDAQMRGTGMELIYNDQAERLEYFKIADLESLRIKSTQAAAISTGTPPAEAPAQAETGPEGPTGSERPEPNTATVAAEAPEQAESALPETPPQIQGEFYKCILSRNVLVDAPDQVIFADEKLYINDIFWSKKSMDSSGEADASDVNEPQVHARAGEPESPAAEAAFEPNVPGPAPAEPNEPNAPPGQPTFITVTCDGGLVIVPRDSTRTLDDSAQTGPNAIAPDGKRAELVNADTERTKFFAQKIDYNAITGDVVASGLSELTYYASSTAPGEASEPVKITARKGARYFKASNQAIFEDCLCRMPQTGLSEPRDVTFSAPQMTVNLPPDRSKQPDLLAAGPTELVFYIEDANRPATEQGPIPVTVTARRQARYAGASSQMVFEGDCRCTMLREDPNVLVEYALLSEQLSVDLAQDVNAPTAGPVGGVKHLSATGDVVNLATTRRAKAGGAFAQALQEPNANGLLSGIELKCRKFDYDAVRQFFLATGPGVIKLNNSQTAVPEPNESSKGFSLRKPCWAVIDRFETLKYLIGENRIIADGGARNMLIGYLSTVDARQQEPVWAEAPHIEALLHETPEAQTEISALTATGGVYYQDSDNRFRGSNLFYDHKTGRVKVWGDASQPCDYNGVPVDGIDLDMNTGKVKANVVGPGALQLNR
ncbi:MAG: hypothetical protein ACYTEK_15545 [Planctomycetota bacterium]|jgi:hypothetical protein